MKTGIKAVILARFSPRPDADESKSNENQIAQAKEYALSKGYEVSKARIFQDSGLTGMDDERHPDPAVAVAKRPGLAAAIQATKEGMVLIVRARDRISRETYIQQYVERMVNVGGGAIEAYAETNESNLSGRIVRAVLSELARDTVERIRLLTHLSMQKYQNRDGRRMSRRDKCPYGYSVDTADDSLLIEVPAEQLTIKAIQKAHREGLGLRAICRRLDAHKITRRGGKPWEGSHGLVRAILKRVGEKKNSPPTSVPAGETTLKD